MLEKAVQHEVNSVFLSRNMMQGKVQLSFRDFWYQKKGNGFKKIPPSGPK